MSFFLLHDRFERFFKVRKVLTLYIRGNVHVMDTNSMVKYEKY